MSIRMERVASVIQRDLGDILRKYQNDSMITVIGVTMSPDLQMAKIYLSIFAPGRDTDAVFAYLNERKSEIRAELSSKLRNQLRRMPELNFYKDDSAEYVNKMEQIFSKIRKDDVAE